MGDDLNWVWFALAGLLGLLAVIVAYRSLLHDRSRGRRRCPRCWYDMSGTTSLTCSECGHEVRRAQRLHKTRRSWRLAMAALALGLLSFVAFQIPQVRASGWWGLVPTTLLIGYMPDLASSRPAAFEELRARIDRGALTMWQWGWLLRRCTGSYDAAWNIELRTAAGRSTQPVQAEIKFNVRADLEPRLLVAPHRLLLIQSPEEQAIVVDHDRPLTLMTRDGRVHEPLLSPVITNGKRAINVRAVVERQSPKGPWIPVWRKDLSFPIVHEESSFTALPLDDPALTQLLRERTSVGRTGDLIDFRQTYAVAGYDDVACPITVEVICNGVIVGRWRDWWDIQVPAPAASWWGLPVPEHLRRHDSGAVWQVRITGDANRAMWRSAPGAFWAGTFTIPIASEPVSP